MTSEQEYILGTHDEEVARLGLQNLIWRPEATETWQRAQFGPGQHLIDIGCGPGFATLDLAQIVGSSEIVATRRAGPASERHQHRCVD